MLSRFLIILASTFVGALWLLYEGPMRVVRILETLPDIVPFWYQLTAFPVLGMLLADLFDLYKERRWTRPTLTLMLEITIVVMLSSMRLDLRIPASGHALLFGHFLTRRRLLGLQQPAALYEAAAVLAMLAMISYIKLAWWDDPITLVLGLAAGSIVCLAGKWLASRGSVDAPLEKG